MLNKKGQYFSFDAIVAAIIFSIGILLFINYFSHMQPILESNMNSDYQDGLRIGEGLLSEGVPSNWHTGSISGVKHFGLLTGDSLDKNKINRLSSWASSDYEKVGNILRTNSNYYILIKYADDYTQIASIGNSNYTNAKSSISVYRGAIIKDGSIYRPVSIQLILWK
jgi:hypothetical protein